MLYKFDSETLDIKRHSVLGRIIIVTSVVAVLSAGSSYYFGFKSGRDVLQNLSPEEKVIILNNYDKFTPQKLKEHLIALNVQYPDIVYAQAVLETGGFTSHIFRSNNNLFGMKVATTRPTTNIGEEDGHAVFKHWRQSVIDYALYSACYIPILSRNEYFDFLGKRYAEDPNYISKLKEIIEKNK
jgi:hypothetical protein